MLCLQALCRDFVPFSAGYLFPCSQPGQHEELRMIENGEGLESYWAKGFKVKDKVPFLSLTLLLSQSSLTVMCGESIFKITRSGR